MTGPPGAYVLISRICESSTEVSDERILHAANLPKRYLDSPETTRAKSRQLHWCFTSIEMFVLPAFARPQLRDVRDVVTPVPRVQPEQPGERHQSTLGMSQPPLERRRIHAGEKRNPPLVQRIQQVERYIDGYTLGIGKLRPRRFIVCLDGRLVFGERQLDARVRVHVAVGQVVHHLLHRPAARPVRCLDLIAGQARDSRSQRTGSGRYLSDQARIIRFGDGRIGHPFPDRKSKIGHPPSTSCTPPPTVPPGGGRCGTW